MLSPILVIGDSKRYEPLFTALRDIEIVAEQVPSPSEGLVVQMVELASVNRAAIQWIIWL